jgi:hypothetical protein
VNMHVYYSLIADCEMSKLISKCNLGRSKELFE